MDGPADKYSKNLDRFAYFILGLILLISLVGMFLPDCVALGAVSALFTAVLIFSVFKLSNKIKEKINK